MIPGPVFVRELITTARKPRYHLARMLFGLLLFGFLTVNFNQFENVQEAFDREYSIEQLNQFAMSMFASISSLQACAVIGLAPALVSGVIVEEKKRRTIQDILTTPLTSLEIIVGKLASRMMHLAVFVFLSLPIVSLLTLFGGVDPALIALVVLMTLSTAGLVAAMSIFVSVISRDVRSAFSLSYALAAFWLLVPTIFVNLPAPNFSYPFLTEAYHHFQELLRWVSVSSPVDLLGSMSRLAFNGPRALVEPAMWLLGSQLVYSLCFITAATLLLRPLARSESSPGRRFRSLREWRFSLLSRPDCGDHPIFWKEAYLSSMKGVTKLATIILGLGVAGLIGWGIFEFLPPAFRAFWFGQGSSSTYGPQYDFSVYIRVCSIGIFIMWAMQLASAASSVVCLEKERDTWISLITTPLSASDIVLGKMAGVFWSTRGYGLLLPILWGLALLAGSMHPIALITGPIVIVLSLWFVTALGVYFSIHAPSMQRAHVYTFLVVFLLNGFMTCCFPVWSFQPLSSLLVTIIAPLQLYVALPSLSLDDEFRSMRNDFSPALIMVGPLLYALGAYFLTRRAVRSFDDSVGRPRKSTMTHPPFTEVLWIEKPLKSADSTAIAPPNILENDDLRQGGPPPPLNRSNENVDL